jgi:hypothetical protein
MLAATRSPSDELVRALLGRIPLQQAPGLFRAALLRAGETSFPDGFLARARFVDIALRDTITEELGPRVAAEIVRDVLELIVDESLSAELRERDERETIPAPCPASHAPSGRRLRRARPPSLRLDGEPVPIVVVTADRTRVVATMRALIRAGFGPQVASGPVECALALGETCPVLVVVEESFLREEAHAMREALEHAPQAAVLLVACVDPIDAMASVLPEAVRAIDALPNGAPTTELVAAAVALIGATRRPSTR